MILAKPAFWALSLICLSGIACRTNESPEAQIDDLQIAAQVKTKLATDVGASSVTNISVNSTNGVVTMSGQVDSADLKAKAIAVANSVPKVVRVVDSLQTVTKPQGSSLMVRPSSMPSRLPHCLTASGSLSIPSVS